MRASEAVGNRGRSLIEGAATGIAFGAGLSTLGAFLVASFRPDNLAMPYWSTLGWLRTDTTGAASFVVVAFTLVVSEYLRLRRTGGRSKSASARVPQTPRSDFMRAVAEVIAVLATAMVVYLSVNAVTHPLTLLLHATHFVNWPSEGTLRVIGLLLCIVSVGWLRYSKARKSSESDA